MATRVTFELTAEERRRLARDLLPEILSEMESALFALQERQGASEQDQIKAAIREAMLQLVWEMEQHVPDPDEGLELSAETIKRLREADAEPRTSLEDVKRELDD